ncbi:glycoside hydrolase family 28 protein [uncultured Alistipes sp.]|jgi:endopolygalacturonase|uniref:glycoside hydrolase family 28 protein n=1 Tax=uncultured Alistipes sp. TaxID=538949 RepID=UPI0025FD57E1|nr:glycoside hydrolase family 28 protein [uncultured Alistipes sp.]
MNLKHAAIVLLAAAATLTTGYCRANAPGGNTDRDFPFVMPEVSRPSIPARTVSIADFGGISDGHTLNTQAFADAIASLVEQGGGRVVVPEGVWFTGPIVLLDNIELHLEQNSVIVFSDDKSLYPLVWTTFEGLETWRCQSPLSATRVKNVAVTGFGVIDGNGDGWRAVKQDKLNPRQWKERVKSGGVLSDDKKTWYPSESYKFGATSGADQNVSTWAKTKEDFESMHDFLRPVMVAIHHCENVLLEGVTFQNSPCWNIHPAMCVNLIVNDIKVRCPDYAQNGDGIDIESCRNVILTNSSFDVGDDGICIKSGKDKAGRERGIACENILVDNCIVFHGHGGFVVGSEMSGGVKNVKVSNCIFSGTDVGLRFKSTRGRGGVVEQIYIEHIAMNDIAQEPLLFDLFYGGKSASEAAADGDDVELSDLAFKPVDETTPAFRDIHIRNVWCRGARRAMYFNGLPEMNVENVTLENTQIYAQTGAQINESTSVMLRNVEVIPENGPALMLNNVKGFSAEGFVCPAGLQPAFVVSGSRNKNISVHSAQITSANSNLSKSAVKVVKINK